MLNSFYFAVTQCNPPQVGAKLFSILPTWYEYLPTTVDAQGHVGPCLNQISDIWLVVAAIIEILLRIATLAAVAFVLYSGILFTTSSGSPDQATRARNTLINALIGLAIAIASSVFIAYLAVQFQ